MTQTIPCRECGQPFQPTGRLRVVCSLTCRQRLAGKAYRLYPADRKCPVCQGPIAARGKRTYCSNRCRALSRRNPPKTCQTCGTEFHAKGEHKDRQRKFCSKVCADQGTRTLTPRQCRECRTTFNPKEQRLQFCSRTCAAKWTGRAKRGPGIRKDARGYILLYRPEHPMAPKSGYLQQHRLVMADHLGRMLEPGEVVHHKNEVKDDNRLENLELLTKHAHDRLPKPKPKPRQIDCPHCGGPILVSGRVRLVEVHAPAALA